MLYTLSQYRTAFPIKNKKVSVETIRRRIIKGLIPTNHKAIKLPGKRGAYIIDDGK